jgi:hypothetical protein
LQVAESTVSGYLKYIPAATRASMIAVILENLETQISGKRKGTARHLAACLFDQCEPYGCPAMKPCSCTSDVIVTAMH